MVQLLTSSYKYDYEFHMASYAYLNRYPNPYAKHVKSTDTIECRVDEDGCLRVSKLVVKTGRLPKFIKPFLGESLDSWIIEKTIVNPHTKKLLSYSANVDHRKFIKVEEYLKYTAQDDLTVVEGKVKFSSNLFGFKQRIEEWSHRRFTSNLSQSREGLVYVMDKLKERGRLIGAVSH